MAKSRRKREAEQQEMQAERDRIRDMAETRLGHFVCDKIDEYTHRYNICDDCLKMFVFRLMCVLLIEGGEVTKEDLIRFLESKSDDEQEPRDDLENIDTVGCA